MVSLHPSRAARYRPKVEWLERRDCPSTCTHDLKAPPADPPHSGNLAPTLQLSVDYLDQRRITLHGFVQDENPAGKSVFFSGMYAGTTITGEDGSFCITVEGSGLGAINAHAVDELMQESAIETVVLTSQGPSIVDFLAVRDHDNHWVFTGRVLDESPGGLTVTFSGLPSLEGMTVLVNEDGTFSLSLNLPEGAQGTVSVQTTDWWSLDSDIASTLVV